MDLYVTDNFSRHRDAPYSPYFVHKYNFERSRVLNLNKRERHFRRGRIVEKTGE